jgi:cell wall-active antibiotic response 4TMS protein YvqF
MSSPILQARVEEPRHPASFSAGAFFVLAGIVFLLEWLDVFQLLAALWPLLLICLGVAVAADGLLLRLSRPYRH